ncbi:hypothetical protein ACHAWX_002161 [Stephanocyclus meneghinianus]
MGSLKQASDDYSKRIKRFWKRIFDDVFSSSACSRSFEEEYRGIHSDKAIELYVSVMDEGRSRELFSFIKKLHSTAAMNCEALRKLVKKFDKGAIARGEEMLTSSFLHELYSSSFSNYPCLEGYIDALRDSLVASEGEDAEDEDSDNENYSIQEKVSSSYRNDTTAVKRRAEELTWLKTMLASIPPMDLSALVAHRGFHCPRDGTNRRPLENSLSAFEMAWCGGIKLCECDVALTKDEKLVLAHDEDFSRLALDPNAVCSKTKVQDLTMKEIISLTFKSGSRPPLLLDVLRSAQAIGGDSKLVIEIKPGNQEACTALVRLFRHHLDLIDRCEVIMSFDAFTMHRLKSELEDMAISLTTERFGSLSPPSKHSFDRRVDSPIKLPRVLLLTVAKEPQKHYELWVDILNPSPIHSWLKHGNKSSLDGVYLQYQPVMLEPAGIRGLRHLSKQYKVGIWGEFRKDPDDYFTAMQLINECGVSYVNTDLPRSFRANASDFKQHRMTVSPKDQIMEVYETSNFFG